ncbi:MAG: hypothetical protein LUD68_00320, partial [Rikenellaceae bacterium]|nr:hypothetical protein [Rikenellaceae bacterium]
RINDGSRRVTFSLECEVPTEEWDAKKEEVTHDNVNFYTLILFKKYLEEKYHLYKSQEKSDLLSRLKTEAHSFIKGAGIEGIARKMFDYFHQEDGIPKYDQFVEAFEKYSGLKKGEYQVHLLDFSILFHTEEKIFEMDTYEGKTMELKRMIENKWLDELAIVTKPEIWNEIYTDPGIDKDLFLCQFLHEWEHYWDEKYQEIQERVGKTQHLDPLKERSWRKFQVFMACYEPGGDVIHTAYMLDDMELYPLALITMLQIYNPEECLTEYCELEFDGSGEWESICLDEEDSQEDFAPDTPVFHIRPYEY